MTTTDRASAPVTGAGTGAADAAARFAHDGWTVVPGVLTPDEVVRLRDDVEASLALARLPFAMGHVLPNASIEAPRTTWVLHHPSVVDAV